MNQEKEANIPLFDIKNLLKIINNLNVYIQKNKYQ